MGDVHRLATLDDVTGLFEIRRKAIVELAPQGMPDGEAKAWAAKLTLAGMAQKLCEFDIWVAELDGVAAHEATSVTRGLRSSFRAAV